MPDLITQQIAAAVSDRQRNRYLDVRTVIESRRTQLGRDYLRVLERELDRFAHNEEVELRAPLQERGLSLVDKAEYEDEVAIKALAARNSALYADDLWQLDRRMALLRGGRKFSSEGNPCGPWALCTAVQEVYGALDVDQMAKLLLYKSYENAVLAEAGAIYRELNAELVARGVLPNLSYQPVRARAGAPGGRAVQRRGGLAEQEAAIKQGQGNSPGDCSSQSSAVRGTEEPAANDPADSSIGAEQSVLPERGSVVPRVTAGADRRQTRVVQAIRTVQQRQSQAEEPRTRTSGGVSWGSLACDGEVGGSDTFPAKEIAGVLEALQRVPASDLQRPGQVREIERGLIEKLEQLCAGTARQKVSALDADTIDLVGMLFNFILNDPRLPDSVKSLLSHLHTPYLKVALLDRTFLDSASHPARQLLDLLAGTGQRWLLEGEEDEKVYQRMRCVVERVLAEFEQDPAFFDEVLRDFAGFVSLLEKRAELTAKRSAEAERGLEQLQQARSIADRELGVRLQSVDMPETLWELLQQSWSDYLVYNYLRHGQESSAWQSAIALIEDVLGSLRAGEAVVPERQLLEQQAALRERLARALEQFGCERPRVDALLKALQHAQLQVSTTPAATAVDGSEQNRPRMSAIARQVENQGGDEEPPRLDLAKMTAQEHELVQKLSSIDFGTWFEFRRDGAQQGARRLRLAWYSSVSGNYMFVNASGVKVVVEPLGNLVRGVLAGAIVVDGMERRNLFERAMTSILVRMNRHSRPT